MGFRFRKSIKLLPGIRINLSKSGVSTSVGVPGATVNLSDKGTRTTVGIPGTGMSYSERVSGNKAGQQSGEPDQQSSGNWLLWVIAAIFIIGVLYGLLSGYAGARLRPGPVPTRPARLGRRAPGTVQSPLQPLHSRD